MSFKGRLIGATVGIAIGLGVMGVKQMNKASAESDVKQDAHVIVQELTTYSANQDYHEEIFEEAHEEAFAVSYDMGSSRRKSFKSASFDKTLYFEYLFQYMRGVALLEEKKEISSAIKDRHDKWRKDNNINPDEWEGFEDE